jgi:hypothetical protein
MEWDRPYLPNFLSLSTTHGHLLNVSYIHLKIKGVKLIFFRISLEPSYEQLGISYNGPH